MEHVSLLQNPVCTAEGSDTSVLSPNVYQHDGPRLYGGEAYGTQVHSRLRP